MSSFLIYLKAFLESTCPHFHRQTNLLKPLNSILVIGQSKKLSLVYEVLYTLIYNYFSYTFFISFNPVIYANLEGSIFLIKASNIAS